MFSGLLGLDVSNPDSLEQVLYLPTAAAMLDVEITEDFAFVACGFSGLWILDISAPESVTTIANIMTGNGASNVIISDTLAYILGPEGMWIASVADITQPLILSYYDLIPRSSGVYNFEIEEQLVYLTQGAGAVNDTILEIIDVSDPQEPTQRGVLRSTTSPSGLAVKDSIVYLATIDSGLVVVDCRDLSSPTQVKRLLDFAVGITLNDSLLFVIDDSLKIFDISDRPDPVLVAMSDCRPSSSYIIEMDVADGFLYWGETTVLATTDVGDPANPGNCEIFDFGVEGEVHGVSAQGTRVAITNSSSGLWVLQNNLLVSVVNSEKDPVPSQAKLFPTFPNPFNPLTTVRFSVPSRQHITLDVFDMLGQNVSTLVDEELERGLYDIVFDGSPFSSGVYFVRLTEGKKSLTRRMMLMK
jgi:hypothetical protein